MFKSIKWPLFQKLIKSSYLLKNWIAAQADSTAEIFSLNEKVQTTVRHSSGHQCQHHGALTEHSYCQEVFSGLKNWGFKRESKTRIKSRCFNWILKQCPIFSKKKLHSTAMEKKGTDDTGINIWIANLGPEDLLISAH